MLEVGANPMLEQPLASILDREEAKRHAAQHFADQIALLQDLTNYGSNLVMCAFNSSKKDLSDIVVCGVLLKQIVEMLDAVETLEGGWFTLLSSPRAPRSKLRST